MNKISAVICTYNEENHIVDCLESLTWVDEIILVDDGSSDRTIELAKQFKVKVFRHKGVGYVEPTRNFAIQKATNSWVLLVDADEQVPAALAWKLQEVAAEDTDVSHVFIPRKNIIFNTWIQHTGWWPDYNIRFFKKETVVWLDEIHSVPQVQGQAMHLEPQEDLALVHQNYTSIQQFLTKHIGYAKHEADKISKKGYTFHAADLLSKPFHDFLSRYFAQEGYKDGLHGLVLSLLMGWYMFITYLLLWEQTKFSEESVDSVLEMVEHEEKAALKEFMYWMRTIKLNKDTNVVSKNLKKILRKLG